MSESDGLFASLKTPNLFQMKRGTVIQQISMLIKANNQRQHLNRSRRREKDNSECVGSSLMVVME